MIEGAVFRIDGERGPAALARLAERIDREGPAALAAAEGDFVALITAEDAIYGFKSFTSQYQLYYREADGAVANRLGFFFDAASRALERGLFRTARPDRARLSVSLARNAAG